MWAGLLNENVLGSFFIDGNSQLKNMKICFDEIVLAIQTILSPNFNNVWFQQDGAPTNYALARRCLDEFFSNR